MKGLASKDVQTAKIELDRLIKYIVVKHKVEWVGREWDLEKVEG